MPPEVESLPTIHPKGSQEMQGVAVLSGGTTSAKSDSDEGPSKAPRLMGECVGDFFSEYERALRNWKRIELGGLGGNNHQYPEGSYNPSGYYNNYYNSAHARVNGPPNGGLGALPQSGEPTPLPPSHEDRVKPVSVAEFCYRLGPYLTAALEDLNFPIFGTEQQVRSLVDRIVNAAVDAVDDFNLDDGPDYDNDSPLVASPQSESDWGQFQEENPDYPNFAFEGEGSLAGVTFEREAGGIVVSAPEDRVDEGLDLVLARVVQKMFDAAVAEQTFITSGGACGPGYGRWPLFIAPRSLYAPGQE